MNNSCAAPEEPKGPAHSAICKQVCAVVRGSVKSRWHHGKAVAAKAEHLFERLKSTPETNLLAASTLSLALVHQMVEEGSEARATQNAWRRIEAGLRGISGFKSELGITPDEFFAGLTQYWMQYRTKVQELDLQCGKSLRDYAEAARSDMPLSPPLLSLPTFLLRMVDLSMELEEAYKGLPEGRKFSDVELAELSSRMLGIYFPAADMLGFGSVANDLRRNGVLLSPSEARQELLRKEVKWVRENARALKSAGASLQRLVLQRLNPILGSQSFQKDPAGIKTPESCVLKMEKKSEIHDRVRMRIVLDCTPQQAHAIGLALFQRMYSPGIFVDLKDDDHYLHPTSSGFTAYQITGKNTTEKAHLVDGYGERNGIPCEVQIIDLGSYLEAMCGSWSRLRYKSGDTEANSPELMAVIDSLLAPFLDSIKNGGHIVEPYVPRAIIQGEAQREKFIYRIIGLGEDLVSQVPITGIDAVVAVAGSAVEGSVTAGGKKYNLSDTIPADAGPLHVELTGTPLAPGFCKILVEKAALNETHKVLNWQKKNGHAKKR